MKTIPAVFVTSARSLDPSGGVGICTREYIQTLESAGFQLEKVTYETDKRLAIRALRKVRPRPYTHRVPPTTVQNALSAVQRTGSRFVFLNLVDLAPIASNVKRGLGKDVKITLLSHGLESVDYLHAIRTKNVRRLFDKVARSTRATLGMQLVAECTHRQFIDQVFCLAPFEVEIERWLGAKKVTWVPRTIPQNALSWSPRPRRLGFVGRLDHAPNREGLELFASALNDLAGTEVRLRVVGEPLQSVSNKTRHLPCVEFLGPLSNEELEKEASTWNCFVNPIFCFARGCSTKLAVALGWQIPVITTPAGCRGYTWRQGVLPIADTPDELAQLAIRMLDSEIRSNARREVQQIVTSAPSLAEVASRVRETLLEESSVGPADHAPSTARSSYGQQAAARAVAPNTCR